MYDELAKNVKAIKATDTSNLVKKNWLWDKNGEIVKGITYHDHNNSYITTHEFNKLTAENFDTKLKQTNLATTVGIDEFVEKTGFDDKMKNLNENVTLNKTKYLDAEKKLT